MTSTDPTPLEAGHSAGHPNKCATCVHIGRIYHDGGLEPDHRCGKSDVRRAEVMKPTGDAAEDFMRNWRVFFDATPGQAACRHYEERPLIPESDLDVLRLFKGNAEASWSLPRATFKFLSPECTASERMNGLYVKQDSWGAPDTRHKAWELTRLGRAELARAAISPHEGGESR